VRRHIYVRCGERTNTKSVYIYVQSYGSLKDYQLCRSLNFKVSYRHQSIIVVNVASRLHSRLQCVYESLDRLQMESVLYVISRYRGTFVKASFPPKHILHHVQLLIPRYLTTSTNRLAVGLHWLFIHETCFLIKITCQPRASVMYLECFSVMDRFRTRQLTSEINSKGRMCKPIAVLGLCWYIALHHPIYRPNSRWSIRLPHLPVATDFVEPVRRKPHKKCSELLQNRRLRILWSNILKLQIPQTYQV
jgi:hypothetical protein